MRTVGLKLEPHKYRCPKCGERFKTKKELESHAQLKHPPEEEQQVEEKTPEEHEV